MASKDNKAEVERKPKRKQAKRQARRKQRQASKQSRVGALDRFQAQRQGGGGRAPADVQGRLDRMNDMRGQIGTQVRPAGPGLDGGPVNAGGTPGLDGGPVSAVDPGTVGQAIQPQPAVQPQPVIQPQPAVEPQPVIQPQPAIEPQPMIEPQPAQIDPVTGQAMPQPGMSGEVDPYMTPNTMPPVTAEEGMIQADLDAAQAQGQTFNIQPPAVAPPEQFYNNQLGGGGGMQNPRDLERVRRKRLALINPQVQQLRPQGRGIPQIRYQGGPAFQGAFQQPPNAGFNGRPQPQPLQGPGMQAQRQPFVR